MNKQNQGNVAVNYKFKIFVGALSFYSLIHAHFEKNERVQIPYWVIAQHFKLQVNEQNRDYRYLSIIEDKVPGNQYLVRCSHVNAQLIVVDGQDVTKIPFGVHTQVDGDTGLSLITKSSDQRLER